MLRLLFLASFTAVLSLVYAQPETDIYLLEIPNAIDTTTSWSAVPPPRNITPRLGYDNQPHFTPDGRYLLFVSMDDHDQTDVYRYDLDRNSTERITRTRNRSEYSPTVTPKGDGYSAVVVEEDGTQRLWFFKWGDEKGKVMMEKVLNIGYHAWYHKKRLAMFILGESPTLQRTHVRWQRPKVVADSIGRCIQPVPGEDQVISFVTMQQDTAEYIMTWSAQTNEIAELLPAFQVQKILLGAQWFTLDGKRESTVFLDPLSEEGWQPAIQVDEGTITRIALSPSGNQMAVVVRRSRRSRGYGCFEEKKKTWLKYRGTNERYRGKA